MVGYHHRKHDMGEGEKQRTKHYSIDMRYTYHLGKQPIQEEKRIYGAHDQQKCHYNHGKVDVEKRYHLIVEQIERVQQRVEQRMADSLEINLGIGKFNVRKGIETAHMEVLKEQRPKAYVLRLCKEIEIFVDCKNIECCKHC